MATRTAKTAEAKATEALAVGNRRVDSLSKRLKEAESKVVALISELSAARTERDYLAQSPALRDKTEMKHVDGGANEEPTGNAGA